MDDNFVGNRSHTRELLRELKEWQRRQHYPFSLQTEASVDLASDPDLLGLMADCNFNWVFVGVETPDQESLLASGKHQNTRYPLEEAVAALTRAGLRVMGAFMIGFDHERVGAGERVRQFMERTSIPTAVFSLLQALPHTPLWRRLQGEGRLLGEDARLNEENLTNFVPTRPLAEIAREYSDALWQVYEPARFLDRTYRHFLLLGPPRWQPCERAPVKHGWRDLQALFILCWRQGIKRDIRWKFWHHLLSLHRRNPRVVGHYISTIAHLEHFLWFRESIRPRMVPQVTAGCPASASSRAPPARAP